MPQNDPQIETTAEGPYGFGIKSLFNTHSSYRFGLEDPGNEKEPEVERQWFHEDKYPVQLSHEEVVKAAWDKYYKDHKIPGNGTKTEDDEEKDSTFNTADVQEALQLADEG